MESKKESVDGKSICLDGCERVLLVNPPFSTPLSPPYALTNICAFLKANFDSGVSVDVLDLNVKFHNIRFSEFGDYFRNFTKQYAVFEYDKKFKEYRRVTAQVYSSSNNAVVKGGEPELFLEMIKKIIDSNPDVVAFSVVYNSQVFYTLALAKALKKKGVRVVVGGPAVNDVLAKDAIFLKNELELYNYCGGKRSHEDLNLDFGLDYSVYDLKEYFTPEVVLPIRTASACYYRQCAFCTHHQGLQYYEYPLENIQRSILNMQKIGCKNVFIVDDIVSDKRLIELSKILDGMHWMCQLKPAMDVIILSLLKKKGLDVVIWGVESGSDRVLKKMRKGTTKDTIRNTILAAHNAGIVNGVYIIFGFPTETEDEFKESIDLLKELSDSIEIISTSIFGLQKGSPVFEYPEEYGVFDVKEEKRTVLEPKITYSVRQGLSADKADALRRNYKNILDKLSKYPRGMNYFREHMLLVKK